MTVILILVVGLVIVAGMVGLMVYGEIDRLLKVLGELVQTTTGKWIHSPADALPNGQGQAPNPALVAGGPIYANSPGRVHFTRIHTRGER